MAYTPQFSYRDSRIVRRIAWAMAKPMTKTLPEIIEYAAKMVDRSLICMDCRDDSFCEECPFKENKDE